MAKGLTVDMWYGDRFVLKKYHADATFCPHGSFGCAYRGHIYDDNGKMVGDYGAQDSTVIEANFQIEWRD